MTETIYGNKYEAVFGKRPYATEEDLTGHPAAPVEA
jgi:hypothetical protein